MSLREGYELLVFASTALFFIYLIRGIYHTYKKWDAGKRGGYDHLFFLGSVMLAVLFWAQVVIHHVGSKSPSLITLNVGGSALLLLLCCLYAEWNIQGLTGRMVAAGLCIVYAFIMCAGFLVHEQWVWFKYFVFPFFLFGSFHGLYNCCAALKNNNAAAGDATGLYLLTVVCVMLQPLFFWEVKENTFMIPIIAIGVHNLIGVVLLQFCKTGETKPILPVDVLLEEFLLGTIPDLSQKDISIIKDLIKKEHKENWEVKNRKLTKCKSIAKDSTKTIKDILSIIIWEISDDNDFEEVPSIFNLFRQYRRELTDMEVQEVRKYCTQEFVTVKVPNRDLGKYIPIITKTKDVNKALGIIHETLMAEGLL